MTELINDNLLKALQKEPVPYTPIWLMRQALLYNQIIKVPGKA